MKLALSTSMVKFTGIGSTLTLLIDLMQPIAPFSMFAFLGFFGLTLIFLGLQIIKKAKDVAQSIIPFTAIMAVLSFGSWAFQNSIPGASENGFLASTFPALEKMQEQVAALVETNERIAVAAEKTAESSQETADNTDEIAKITQLIAEESKKETSADPIKELANLNINYDEQGFLNYLDIAQPQILSLFVQAGLPIEIEDLWIKIKNGHVSPKSSKALVNSGFAMTKEECNFSSLIHREFEGEIKPVRRVYRGDSLPWVDENHYPLLELSNPNTVETILTLCPEKHALQFAKRIAESGIAYYEAYEGSRLAGLKSCEKSVDQTSFEEFAALKFRLIYENGQNSTTVVYDEAGETVQPRWPNRELTLPEEIFAEDDLYRLSDYRSFQFQRGVARNDTLIKGKNISGYVNVLKSICLEVAYEPLGDYMLHQYKAIVPAFEAAR
jgi:hypothetical protein